MNLVITNHATVPVPVLSSDEGGWHESAMPQIPLTITRDETNDLIIGDKPGVSEQIAEGLGVVVTVIKEALARIHARPKVISENAAETADINVVIGNNGPNHVRVILGDGQTDAQVAPGTNYQAMCQGYVEVRELGLAPAQGETPK